ncbi:uncharacterized protein METZ01_LOCUS149418, partial [marine metagenome]
MKTTHSIPFAVALLFPIVVLWRAVGSAGTPQQSHEDFLQ